MVFFIMLKARAFKKARDFEKKLGILKKARDFEKKHGILGKITGFLSGTGAWMAY